MSEESASEGEENEDSTRDKEDGDQGSEGSQQELDNDEAENRTSKPEAKRSEKQHSKKPASQSRQSLERLTDSGDLSSELERAIEMLSQDPDSLSDPERREIGRIFSKYFDRGEIELEGVCNANGGRSPVIQVMLYDLLAKYGISAYFTITSSGSKLNAVKTRELPGAFKANIIRKGVKYNKTVRQILTAEELGEAKYILEQLSSAGDDKDQINSIYKSNPKLRGLIDKIDRICIRAMHTDEARTRDRVLNGMGLYGILFGCYYKGNVPAEVFPGFYGNRMQTQASATTIYIASQKSNATEIIEICKKSGVDDPTIYIIDIEDALGGSDQTYKATFTEIRAQLIAKLPTMVHNYALSVARRPNVACSNTIQLGAYRDSTRSALRAA